MKRNANFAINDKVYALTLEECKIITNKNKSLIT